MAGPTGPDARAGPRPRSPARRQAAIPAAIDPAIALLPGRPGEILPLHRVGDEPELEQHRRHARAGEHVEGGLLHAPVGRPGAAHQRAVDGLGEARALGQVRLVLEVVEDAAHGVGRVAAGAVGVLAGRHGARRGVGGVGREEVGLDAAGRGVGKLQDLDLAVHPDKLLQYQETCLYLQLHNEQVHTYGLLIQSHVLT